MVLLLFGLFTFAQTLTVTKEFTLVPNSSVLAMYKNQFGKWEMPDLDDTFPYAVIRVALDGEAKDVSMAKKKLGLYLGTQRMVVDVYTDNVNEILFLIPSGAGHVQLQCGDGCTPYTIIDLPRLRSNMVYSGRVHFVPVEEVVETYAGAKVYPFTLRVEPINAKVEIIANGMKQEWMLQNGMATLNLIEGLYKYRISASNYSAQEGSFLVNAEHKDTTIILVPKYGLLSIVHNNTNLSGLSVNIQKETSTEARSYDLPLHELKCTPASYKLSIKKPGYKLWTQNVTIAEGEHEKIAPLLIPKQSQKASSSSFTTSNRNKTYLMLEGGFALNPSWSIGLMCGQTYCKQSKVGAGWYVKARTNFQSRKDDIGLIADEGGEVDGELMYYTGNRKNSMWMFNAGLLMNFLQAKHSNNALGMYVGVGAGSYTSLWELTNGQWLEYGHRSAHGVSCGVGLIGSIKGFTLSAGVNTIGFKYLETEIGLGWMF